MPGNSRASCPQFEIASAEWTPDHLDEPIRRNVFRGVWRRAAKAAALPAGTGFHALRHFCGVDALMQSRLGHASASETLDTYSHLWADSEDRTREAVGAVLGSGSRVSGVSLEAAGG